VLLKGQGGQEWKSDQPGWLVVQEKLTVVAKSWGGQEGCDLAHKSSELWTELRDIAEGRRPQRVGCRCNPTTLPGFHSAVFLGEGSTLRISSEQIPTLGPVVLSGVANALFVRSCKCGWLGTFSRRPLSSRDTSAPREPHCATQLPSASVWRNCLSGSTEKAAVLVQGAL
jgi:hypothetical protein